MNRRTFLAVAAGTVVATAGCFGTSNRELPEDPTGEWRQQAHDRRNTGAADVEVPSRGNIAWVAGDAGSIEPVVSDGMVYSVGSRVTALNARTGEQE